MLNAIVLESYSKRERRNSLENSWKKERKQLVIVCFIKDYAIWLRKLTWFISTKNMKELAKANTL